MPFWAEETGWTKLKTSLELLQETGFEHLTAEELVERIRQSAHCSPKYTTNNLYRALDYRFPGQCFYICEQPIYELDIYCSAAWPGNQVQLQHRVEDWCRENWLLTIKYNIWPWIQ